MESALIVLLSVFVVADAFITYRLTRKIRGLRAALSHSVTFDVYEAALDQAIEAQRQCDAFKVMYWRANESCREYRKALGRSVSHADA